MHFEHYMTSSTTGLLLLLNMAVMNLSGTEIDPFGLDIGSQLSLSVK